jgi:pilus assembly protein CpaF
MAMELRERLQGQRPTAASDARPDSFAELKDRIHLAVISDLGPRLYNESLTQSSLREVVIADVRNRLAQERGLAIADRDRLVQEIADDTLGHGPIEPLLQDDSVTEVMVNGPDSVWVEREGTLHKTPVRFTDEHHLRRIINKIVAQIGRRVDESSPMVDARLPDGSRVNAVLPPLSLIGPLLTIRKFSKHRWDLGGLVQIGSMPPEAKEFLEACIRAELNILVSGGTGSGKTTLLNAMSSAIPGSERIVTIEDAAELRLDQAHVLRLEARPKNIEGQGEIPIRELVRNSLRMRPDRIIVGEVRGSEALDMLQAMNTGHDGSLSTCHANSPRDAVARIESMVLMAGVDFPIRAIRQQVSRALDLVVQIERFSDGKRRVTSITEVQRMEGDTVTLQEIFEYRIDRMHSEGGGALTYTGLRPTSDKFEKHAVPLPRWMDQHNFAPSGPTAMPGLAERVASGRPAGGRPEMRRAAR